MCWIRGEFRDRWICCKNCKQHTYHKLYTEGFICQICGDTNQEDKFELSTGGYFVKSRE